MGRTSKRTRCSAGRILMLVLALTVPLFAQEQSTSAIWRGLVKNSVGTPIVGAKVRLKGTSAAESTTAADGSFSLAALPAGKYKLTIVADGTTATYAQNITLTSDSPAVVITVSNSREITVATQQQRIRRAARNSFWNTFWTAGKCPACHFQWEVTACPQCGQTSDHRAWYVSEP